MTPPASSPPLRVLAAPDKFRGTATGPEAARAMADGAVDAGMACRQLPLADGGEGTLEVFGGANRWSRVTGPNGRAVAAGWRLDGHRAVIEMAAASGLLVAGGPERNNPVTATTRGTGELIAAALDAGATEIMVGLGGSATTDGGAGALEVLAPGDRSIIPDAVRLTICTDVRTRFVDAATVFGPQKGAGPELVTQLEARLLERRHTYWRRFGVDVGELDGSGAAGGLAGGLAAIGGVVADGFATLAAAAGLATALEDTQVVLTGEGRLDDTSTRGKVVGGVIAWASRRAIPVIVVCGASAPDAIVPPGVTVVSLAERFGLNRAMADTTRCLRLAVAEQLRSM